MTEANIKSGFEACGTVPFNAEKNPYEAYLLSLGSTGVM